MQLSMCEKITYPFMKMPKFEPWTIITQQIDFLYQSKHANILEHMPPGFGFHCLLNAEATASPHTHTKKHMIKSDISSLLHIKSFHDPCLTCTSHNLEYSKDKHRIFTHGASTLEWFTFRKEVVDKFYFLPFFSLPKKILFQETWEQCLSVIVVFPLNVWEPRVQSLPRYWQ